MSLLEIIAVISVSVVLLGFVVAVLEHNKWPDDEGRF